jgi:hypothetical protein
MAKVTKIKNITFRTRGDLKDRLGAAADEYGRSLSEEVEHRLEQSFLYEDRIREMSERIKKLEQDRETMFDRVMSILKDDADADRRDDPDLRDEAEAGGKS